MLKCDDDDERQIHDSCSLYSRRGLVLRYHLIPSHFIVVAQSLMNISAVAHRRARRALHHANVRRGDAAPPANPSHARRRRRPCYDRTTRHLARNEIKQQRTTSSLSPFRQTHPDGRFLTRCYKLLTSLAMEHD